MKHDMKYEEGRRLDSCTPGDLMKTVLGSLGGG